MDKHREMYRLLYYVYTILHFYKVRHDMIHSLYLNIFLIMEKYIPTVSLYIKIYQWIEYQPII